MEHNIQPLQQTISVLVYSGEIQMGGVEDGALLDLLSHICVKYNAWVDGARFIAESIFPYLLGHGWSNGTVGAWWLG